MTGGGAAVMLEDAELDPLRLRGLATELLDDGERLRAMAQAAGALARPDAAARVADEVLAAIGQPVGR